MTIDELKTLIHDSKIIKNFLKRIRVRYFQTLQEYDQGGLNNKEGVEQAIHEYSLQIDYRRKKLTEYKEKLKEMLANSCCEDFSSNFLSYSISSVLGIFSNFQFFIPLFDLLILISWILSLQKFVQFLRKLFTFWRSFLKK